VITMEQAEAAVNKRLDGLVPEGEDERNAPITDAALLCSGTNILGPELVERLTADTLETIVRIAATDDIQCAVAGALNRIFWLGYAYGKADGDA
jgi:hypothetical protein